MNRVREKWMHFLFYIEPEPDRVSFVERLRLVALYAVALLSLVALLYNARILIEAGRYGVVLLLVFCLALMVVAAGLFFYHRTLHRSRTLAGWGFFLMITWTIVDAGGNYGLGSLYFLILFSLGYLLFHDLAAFTLPVYFFIGMALRLAMGQFHPESIFNEPEVARRILVPFGMASMAGILSSQSMRYIEKRLSRLAFSDEATGLPNRRKFEELLFGRALLPDAAFSLLGIKFFQLSRLSGTHGPEYQDRVLTAIARKLEHVVGPQAILGRISESILGVILPPTDLEELQTLARNVLSELYDPIRMEESVEYMQLSCGITRFPDDSAQPEDMLRNIIALCEQQNLSPGVITVYNEDQIRIERENFEISMLLNRLEPEKELQLVFQPKLDLKSGLVHGAEVLVRWPVSVRGEISPVRFIPLAEENGSIVRISRWIIHHTLALIGSHPGALQVAGIPQKYAINVSAIDVRAPDFVEFVESLLDAYAVDPSHLELELTERMIMTEDAHTRQNLLGLQKLGVKLAIDDFGTGYSSLNYLHRIPVDTIKIDKSFVDQVHPAASLNSLAIMEAVISLGISLGLELTAEGIETEYQAGYLCDRRCHLGQGWLYSRPVTFLHFLDFAEKSNMRSAQTAAPARQAG